MRAMSMQLGHQPATALAWQDTADIHVVPLDAFGAACIEQARYLDPTLWSGDRRLRVVVPGEKASDDAPPALPAVDADEAGARGVLKHFFNSEASPEGDLDHCILVGSLMESRSAAWSITFLTELFADPRLLHLWRCGCFWACSETTSNVPYTQYHAALASAQEALATIDRLHGEGNGKPWRAETPQVIVGRTGGAATPLLPKEDSVLVVALGLLCRIYEIRGRLDKLNMTGQPVPRPFFVGRMKNGGTDGPSFVHFGGSIIAAHPSLLARAAAATLAQRWLTLLARQSAPEANLGPRLDEQRQDLGPVIRNHVEAAMAEAGRIASAENLSDKDGGLSVDWLRQVLTREELLQAWRQHVVDHFGWKQMSVSPLESWDQSLQEVDSLTRMFFDDQMAGYLKAFETAWPRVFQQGVVRALDDAAASEMIKPDGTMRPHLMVRTVLHQLHEEIEQCRRTDQEQRHEHDGRKPMDNQSFEKAPDLLQDLMLKLKRTIRSIPSPLAFYLRIPVVMAIAFVLAQWSNVSAYAYVPPEWTNAVNAIVGLGAGAVFVFYLLKGMRAQKAKLEKEYEAWLTLLCDYHEERFHRAADRSRALVWDTCADWCAWVSEPAPPDKRVPLGNYCARRSGLPQHLSDALYGLVPEHSIHSFVHDYATELPRAAEHCRVLVAAALRAFGGVRRKLLLPPFNDSDEGLRSFQAWLVEHEVIPKNSASVSDWCEYLGDLMRRLPATLDDQTVLLHARLPLGGTGSDPPEWTANIAGALPMPDAEAFARTDDAVPPAFAPLVARLREDRAIAASLEDLIATWCYKDGTVKGQPLPEVMRRLSLCDPCSPPGTINERCAVVPAAHPLVEKLASESDRVFTVESLAFFAFLSVARGVPLSEAQRNFSITASPALEPQAEIESESP